MAEYDERQAVMDRLIKNVPTFTGGPQGEFRDYAFVLRVVATRVHPRMAERMDVAAQQGTAIEQPGGEGPLMGSRILFFALSLTCKDAARTVLEQIDVENGFEA